MIEISLSLQTIGFHSKLAESSGFQVKVSRDMSEHLATHYMKMLEAVHSKKSTITERDGKDRFQRIVKRHRRIAPVQPPSNSVR